jgi:hypothetical protein
MFIFLNTMFISINMIPNLLPKRAYGSKGPCPPHQQKKAEPEGSAFALPAD